MWLIEAEPVVDERGSFRRHFCQEEYKKNRLEFNIVQSNISENPKKYTLRGFHYQIQPFEENKTLTCLSGSFYDVIIDLRLGSDTFMKSMSVELVAGDNLTLFVPAGCANAYLTLEDSTVILYYMSEFFAPKSYRGFRYNDPSFSIDWPYKPEIISSKDKNFPDFDLNKINK